MRKKEKTKCIKMSDPDRLKRRSPLESSLGGSHFYFGWRVGLCTALFALVGLLSYASDWYPVDNTADGIQIFRKEVGNSSLVAFRGIGVVEAPLPLVATVIFDTKRRLEWIEGLVDSRIIHWGKKNDFVEYDHIGLPFFLRDRDFVSKVTMSFDPSKKEMVFHYQPSDDPSAPQTGYIRGEMIDMTFTLSSIDNGKTTRVDAEFLCDPKGMLPKWLVNFFLGDWPKTTFRNLRKEVLKPDLSIDPRFSELVTRGMITQ